LSICREIKPEIENSLYSTFPFLKKVGYFPPRVSILLSKIVDLKEATLGLYLIFKERSPSDKKASSKSAVKNTVFNGSYRRSSSSHR
jgi:hypothetical protein